MILRGGDAAFAAFIAKSQDLPIIPERTNFCESEANRGNRTVQEAVDFVGDHRQERRSGRLKRHGFNDDAFLHYICADFPDFGESDVNLHDIKTFRPLMLEYDVYLHYITVLPPPRQLHD